jgi:hypothetical protein
METTLKAFNGIAVVVSAWLSQYIWQNLMNQNLPNKKGLNIHQPFSEVTSADDRD